MIEVIKLTKVYGKKDNAFKALSDVSFTPTNSKSTLIHIMSDLDRPESGEVIIDYKTG